MRRKGNTWFSLSCNAACWWIWPQYFAPHFSPFEMLDVRLVYSLPRKKVYTFVELSTQNRGGQMKSGGCATHSIELVKTGPSLNLKLNGGCGASPTLPLVPLAFGYLPLIQVYTFWWRLYVFWATQALVTKDTHYTLRRDGSIHRLSPSQTDLRISSF